jgi:DNA-binding XRE family transcriptional regulator
VQLRVQLGRARGRDLIDRPCQGLPVSRLVGAVESPADTVNHMAEPARRQSDFEKWLAAAALSRPRRIRRDPLRVRVGQAIHDRRVALRITQSELAGLLGVSQPSVSAWEGGNALPPQRSCSRLLRSWG